MKNLLRTAADALAHLADKAHQWADGWGSATEPGEAAQEFAGVDIVGIDFSTSIQAVAAHVIQGWDRYRSQVDALRPDHGVWVFGVNAIPFPLTRRPVPPRRLPSFRAEHFQQRGDGAGLIEYGSAFHDYLLVALGYAQQLGVFDNGAAPLPVTIALLCDGWPNGGTYRASDVRPLLDEARARGVRLKLVAFAQSKYWNAMYQFGASLGLTSEELEFVWYDGDVLDGHSIHSGFGSLSRF